MSQLENDYLALDAAMGQMKLDDLEENDFLEHYQIKGAKHGIRRFQNYDGSLTPAGRERYGVGAARTKKSSDDKASKKAEKKAAREEKAAERKAKNEAVNHERFKKYLRNHPDKIYKHRKRLTQEDLDDLTKKIEFDKKCSDISYDHKQRALKSMQQTQNFTKTLNDLFGNTIGIANNAFLVYNWLYDRRASRGEDVSTMHKLPRMVWPSGDSKKPGS